MNSELNQSIIGGNNFPTDLRHLGDRVNAEAVEYADRADHVKQIEDGIAKRDHRMGIYVGQQIVEQIQDWIAKGGHRIGMYVTKQIIERRKISTFAFHAMHRKNMGYRHLPILAVILSSLPAISAPGAKKGSEVVYLDCTGTRPVWTGSWAHRPEGVDSDKAKLVVRLDLAAQTAMVEALFDRDDFVFEIKSKQEWYYGAGTRTIARLDGQVMSSNISLNRINGGAYIGFEVAASPKNGSKIAFSGTCERGAVKF